jgi:hypothetical protein
MENEVLRICSSCPPEKITFLGNKLILAPGETASFALDCRNGFLKRITITSRDGRSREPTLTYGICGDCAAKRRTLFN